MTTTAGAPEDHVAEAGPGRTAALVVAVVGALVSGGAAAAATGVLVFAVAASDDRGGEFEALGDAVVGVLAGALVGTVAFTAALVVGVRRAVPRGRRLVTGIAAVAACIGVPAAIAVGGESVRRGGLGGLVLVATSAALCGGVVLVGWAAGIVASRRAVPLLVAAALGIGVPVAVGTARAPAIADAARAERYEAAGVPLALVDGRTLDPPVAGWRLTRVAQGWSPDDVTVTFATGGQWVELSMQRPAPTPGCPPPEQGRTCGQLGSLDDGTPIRGVRLDAYTPNGEYEEIWVDLPDGRWSLDGPSYPQGVDGDDAVALLRSLRRVDAETFTAAT
jgi:hypothetical protein